MFLRHKLVLSQINKNVPPPIKVNIRYLDVEITAIFVFVTTQLFVMVALPLALTIIQSVYHIVPVKIARRLKIDKQPLSLTCQAWGFLINATLLAIALAIHTTFVYTRSATIIVSSDGTRVSESIIQTELNALDIKPRYQDTLYIQATTETPWAVVGCSFAAVLMTFVAAKQQARAPVVETTGVDELRVDA